VKELQPNIIDQWPEILTDIVVKEIPVEYIYSVTIMFKNGNLWEILLPSKEKRKKHEEVEEIINVYSSTISSIDIKIDFKKIKKDSTKAINKLLKSKLK